jgi:serine/threonine-protein kinase
MPRGSPSRPVPQAPPQRGSPSRPTPVVEPPRGRALVEDDLHRAEQALSMSLGPVARTLVKRAARNANTPWELFASLAAEVPEGPERERFLAAQPEV